MERKKVVRPPATTTPTPTAPTTTTPEIYTFQQEFNDASRPLLRADGGPFNPYFTYFGGPAQPDGPNGYRWWNDELQVYTTNQYTPAPYNPFTVSNGILTIAGKPTPAEFVNSPKPYVSGTLETSNGGWWDSDAVRAARGGFEQKYGYWEARIRIPRGKGLWTGFWLAGGHIPATNGKGGELDIFETIGDGRIHQTVHDWWGAPDINDSYAYAPAWNYADDFHTYGLLWTANEIVWYVDGIETRRASAATVARYRDLCGPLYLCITLGVGGSWPGSPDATTPFPALMDIEYVRVRAA
ncbi:glycoside hydrolase family 16 protein [Ramlibacter sp.]|uniref:glycoside hydrolase family 16 protein n=1 Tax=Ramlibacter sp. TaxID=1917967 RepID=UPI002B676D8D|nr:glycoside hydrolase family 16 protein [Ramlibacter sp.]HWI80382.1 glycoside hydrolase family 16 protein [Ramlibacter sp.]